MCDNIKKSDSNAANYIKSILLLKEIIKKINSNENIVILLYGTDPVDYYDFINKSTNKKIKYFYITTDFYEENEQCCENENINKITINI